MIGFRSGKNCTAILLSSASGVVLSSCTVPSDITLTSTGRAAAPIGSVTITEADEDGATRGSFAAALRRALEDRAIGSAEGAPVILEYSISRRDAETGIADTPPSGVQDVTWQSRQRKSRLFDGCDVKRLRGGLLLVERSSGAILYRGSGDLDTCEVSESQLGQLAEALVDDAFPRNAAPQD